MLATTRNKPDLGRLDACVLALAETFDRKASEAMITGYHIGLDGVPIEAVERATAQAIAQCKWMPRPVELRELAGEMTAEHRAVIAWEAAVAAVSRVGYVRSVRFSDPVTSATIRNLGGWDAFSESLTRKAEPFVRKDFERIYQSLFATGISAEMGAALPGWAECSNGVTYQSQAAVEVGVEVPPLPSHRIKHRAAQLPPVEMKRIP